jgi:uncharacterized protein YbjT (DUF2867 family)
VRPRGQTSSLEILVLGATGRFSPLVGMLIERGHRVRAATRRPDLPRAAVLRRSGAEVARVDLDDPRSIERAARGVDAVFAAGTLHAAGPLADARHGDAVVVAAAAASVGQLVFVSVAGADRESDVPAFESKRQVEKRLRASPVPHTIIAPVYLMENLGNPWNRPVLAAGRFPSPIRSERPLHQIAVVDVVSFAAHVLEHRLDFLGERIEIASDRLSALEAAATVGKLISRPRRNFAPDCSLGRRLRGRQAPRRHRMGAYELWSGVLAGRQRDLRIRSVS